MDRFWQDFRYGTRLLFKNPGLTAVAVISLVLGIGANTTIFALVNALFLRPLPVSDPEQLVAVHTSDFSGPPHGGSSYPDYLDFKNRTDVFSGLSWRARPSRSAWDTVTRPGAFLERS